MLYDQLWISGQWTWKLAVSCRLPKEAAGWRQGGSTNTNECISVMTHKKNKTTYTFGLCSKIIILQEFCEKTKNLHPCQFSSPHPWISIICLLNWIVYFHKNLIALGVKKIAFFLHKYFLVVIYRPMCSHQANQGVVIIATSTFPQNIPISYVVSEGKRQWSEERNCSSQSHKSLTF